MLYTRQERRRSNRLHEVTIDAQAGNAPHKFSVCPARHHNNRRVPKFRVLTDHCERLLTAEPRHLDIEQNKIDDPALELLDGVEAVFRNDQIPDPQTT